MKVGMEGREVMVEYIYEQLFIMKEHVQVVDGD